MSFFSDMENIYAKIDHSVKAALELGAAEGRTVACGMACDACCKQPIPLSLPESLAIIEYVKFKMDPEIRGKMRLELARRGNMPAEKSPCPLLLNNRCQAYAARPIACRRFLVAGRKCAQGEDPTATRPGDMLIPSRQVFRQAMLDIFSLHEKYADASGLPQVPPRMSDSEKIDFALRHSNIIQNLDWKSMLAQ